MIKYLIGFVIGLIFTLLYDSVMYIDARNMVNFLQDCNYQVKNKNFVSHYFSFGYNEELRVTVSCHKK